MAKTHPSGKPADKQADSSVPVQRSTPRGSIIHHLSGAPFHLLLLALVGLAAYANTFHAPFVFDDKSSIVDNPVIKDLGSFLSGAGYAYNPRRFVGYLSFALNYQLGGLNVTGYHLVNLAVHILTAWLVYALARLTLRTPFFEVSSFKFQVSGSSTLNLKLETLNFVPLLAALLFVAHPLQTQAVTYIVQRLASLATLFYLAALVCYVKARMFQVSGFKPQVGKHETLNLKPETLIFFALSLLAALLALRTKEIAATLPITVLLYEFSFFAANGRRKLILLTPLLLTILIVPLGMLQTGKPLGELLSDVSEMARQSQTISRGDYLLTQFAVIATYLRLLFLPVGQNLDYDYPIYNSLFAPRVFLSFLLLLALFGLALWLYYKGSFKFQVARFRSENLKPETLNLKLPFAALRLIAFGILWFFITLAVESSVIPISDVIFEHRLYLPSVGACIALASLAAIVFSRYSARVLVAWSTVIVVILSAATYNRNRTWQDDLTLWSDAAAKSPGKFRPHNNLGNSLVAKGLFDKAIEEFGIALRLEPADADALNNLGVAYSKKGWGDMAIIQFKAAIRLNPNHVAAHNNLGEAWGARGAIDDAIHEYQLALSLKPHFADARNNLGTAFIRKGWIDQAIGELLKALQVNPADGDTHFNLALAYELKGWHDKALDQYRTVLQLKPNDKEAVKRMASLPGNVDNAMSGSPPTTNRMPGEMSDRLATASQLINSGRIDEGIRELEKALRLNPDSANIHNNLGVAYGMKGNADKAIENLAIAVRLNPDDPDSHLNLARAYEMKGLNAKAEKEKLLAEKLKKQKPFPDQR